MKPEWQVDWPNLGHHNASFHSPETPDYNCVAFGAGKNDEWWEPYVIPPDEPGIYWPPDVNPDNTPDDWAAAFATVGFEPCDDRENEPLFLKVAIYANAEGTATHVARQLVDGRWASKLGVLEDIIHDDLAALEDGLYGKVCRLLKRPRLPGDP